MFHSPAQPDERLRNSLSSSACRSLGCGIHAVSQLEPCSYLPHASPIGLGMFEHARISHQPQESEDAGLRQTDGTETVQLLIEPLVRDTDKSSRAHRCFPLARKIL
jgi:hypothetical protein